MFLPSDKYHNSGNDNVQLLRSINIKEKERERETHHPRLRERGWINEKIETEREMLTHCWWEYDILMDNSPTKLPCRRNLIKIHYFSTNGMYPDYVMWFYDKRQPTDGKWISADFIAFSKSKVKIVPGIKNKAPQYHWHCGVHLWFHNFVIKRT